VALVLVLAGCNKEMPSGTLDDVHFLKSAEDRNGVLVVNRAANLEKITEPYDFVYRTTFEHCAYGDSIDPYAYMPEQYSVQVKQKLEEIRVRVT